MNGPCILQVEDDENDIFLLQYAFRREEVAAHLATVRDGQSAIDYLSGIGEFGDRTKFPVAALMLLDLKLPRKSGLEVLEWTRGHPAFRELPVVVLTSSSRPDDILAAYRVGANAYLVKPNGTGPLRELVRALAEFWLQHNRLPALAGLPV